MAQHDVKPAYVLIPGLSHTPEFFDAFVTELKGRGIHSTAVALPSIGKDTKGRTFEHEVEAVQTAVLQFLDEKNQNVILLSHSRGGFPGSRAVKGLDKHSRSIQGKKTGIIEIVFLAAYIIPENPNMAHYTATPTWISKAEDDTILPNETAIPLLFSDLEADAGKRWFARFEPQRNDFGSEEKYAFAPWRLSVPKTYIVTTDDKAGAPAWQLQMLQAVIDETWSIKTIKAGHEVFLSQPAKLADLLLAPTY